MEADALAALRAVLPAPTVRAFDLHHEAISRGDWVAAGVWGAVFLEAFLENAMTALGLAVPDRLDLGTAITRLHRERQLQQGRAVLDRCEAVRLARNALVHAGGTGELGVETHTRTIAAYLKEIVQLAGPWFASIGASPPAAAIVVPDPIGRVFVSKISPHLPRQRMFLNDLCKLLRDSALEPVEIELDEYDKKDPIAPVIRTIRGCDALLCIGLERSHAYLLCHREGSEKQAELPHGFYSSGWLHIEAGVAYALGKPVFVLCQERIVSDGVFDRDWNSSPPFVMTSLPLAVTDPAVQRCIGRLKEEVRRIKDVAASAVTPSLREPGGTPPGQVV
jgi:hypothetical protein